jgi:hypothetical protein
MLGGLEGLIDMIGVELGSSIVNPKVENRTFTDPFLRNKSPIGEFLIAFSFCQFYENNVRKKTT